MNVAVIGGGVAGVVASYLISKVANVTIFEANDYLGGHTNTIVVEGPDAGLAVDTGFIVLNDKNYPLFHRFLGEIGVPVRWSDMSFGFHSEVTGFEYAGTTLNGLFCDRRNVIRPAFYRFLGGIVRCAKRARSRLEDGSLGELTLDQFLLEERVESQVIESYLLPMGAAIWSAPSAKIREFPAQSFFRFFLNHGLLGLRDRPRWQTVVGGSFRYVRRFRELFPGRIELSSPIAGIKRGTDGVVVRRRDGRTESFDRVVIATHADQALRLLDDPSPDETRLLGAWCYEKNRTVLHTDISLLPPSRRAWASWNFREAPADVGESPVLVTYHMNRLQGIRASLDYCVTLNAGERIKRAAVIKEIDYEHPQFDLAALRAQPELPRLNGSRSTYYCGSYFGYGFHEDAVRSAVQVAEGFGAGFA